MDAKDMMLIPFSKSFLFILTELLVSSVYYYISSDKPLTRKKRYDDRMLAMSWDYLFIYFLI